MFTCPDTVTSENFSSLWKYASRKCYWSKKKYIIRSIAVPVSQFIYFACFMILAYGVFYSMMGSGMTAYVNQVPELVSLWQRFSGLLFASVQTEAQRLIRCALFLYLPPFAASVPIALAVMLLYHPRGSKETGNQSQDARELWVLSKHAQVYAQRKESNTANICAVFAGMISIAVICGFFLYQLNMPALRAQVEATANSANLRLFLYAAAIFFIYRILNIPLYLLLKLLHHCHVPQKLVEITEAYSHGRQPSQENETV